MTFISKENFKAGDSWLDAGAGGGGGGTPTPLFPATYVHNGTDWVITGGDPVTGPSTGIAIILTSQAVPPAVILGTDDPANHAATYGDIDTYDSVQSVRWKNGLSTWASLTGMPPTMNVLSETDNGVPERIVVGIYSDTAGTVPIVEHGVNVTPTVREGESEPEAEKASAKKAPAKRASKRSK